MWSKVSKRFIYPGSNASTFLAELIRALIDFIPRRRGRSAISTGDPVAVALVKRHSGKCSNCMRLNTWLISFNFWPSPSGVGLTHVTKLDRPWFTPWYIRIRFSAENLSQMLPNQVQTLRRWREIINARLTPLAMIIEIGKRCKRR